ncbi:MAG: AAA family ATPase, partial [Actinomycetota bacterium]
MTTLTEQRSPSPVFTEADLLLVHGAVRLAEREGPKIIVSDDLHVALLVLAKAIRLNHVAIALGAAALDELLLELWSEHGGHEGEVTSPIAPNALVTALLEADARLVAREDLGAGHVPPTGPPIVLSMTEGSVEFATIRRYAFAECEIATRLLEAASTEHRLGADGVPLPNPSDLAPHDASEPRSDEVTRFIDGALTRRISVLTGGPGTGKTTAVATFLKRLAEHAQASNRSFSVALCAPTAKAAVRMREAIDQSFGPLGLERFSADLLIAPGSGSIHRLLKIRPDASVSTIELECDFIIVDEVSMLELTLLEQIVRCGKRGHLVLVGDPDQLVSVEVGAVL